MKRISQRQLPVFVSQIGIAPLADLAFMLMLVLLVTVPLLRRERMNVTEPQPTGETAPVEVAATPTAPTTQLKLKISSDQTLWLNGIKIPGDHLLQLLKTEIAKHQDKDVGVLIEMPENFAAGPLAQLMDEMHRAGVKKTSVVVVPATKKR